MTVGMTNKQALSCARVLAKRMGLVLLEQNMTINNQQAYKLVVRKTREVVIENMTLHSVHYNFDHGVVEHHLSYI